MKTAFLLILSGMAAGILISPDKGSATWQKLEDQFNDWMDKASVQVNDLAYIGKDLVSESIIHGENESKEQ